MERWRMKKFKNFSMIHLLVGTLTLVTLLGGCTKVGGGVRRLLSNEAAVSITVDESQLSFQEGQSKAIPVQLSSARSSDLTLQVQIVADPPSRNDQASDFLSSTISLTIPAGQTQTSLNISSFDDGIFEQTEAFRISIAPQGDEFTGNDTWSAALTVLDNEPVPTVQFSLASSNVNEGAGTHDLVVTMSPPSTQSVVVGYTRGAGTATYFTDHSFNDGNITFLPLETTKNVQFTLADDSNVEPAETIIANLSVQSGTATIGALSSHTTNLLDNDQPMLSLSNVSATEGQALTFRAQLTAAAATDVTFTWSTANDSAIAGTHYTAASTNATILAGQLYIDFSVSSTNTAAVCQTDRVFGVNLSNIVGAAPGVVNATGTITDDDFPSLSVAANSAEEGNSLPIAATLSAACSTQAISFSWSNSAGTATANTDFTQITNQSATIVAGQTSVNLATPTIEDGVDEPDETFTVTVSNISAGSISGATAIGTILDDDVTPVITLGSPSAGENAGSVTVTVTLSAPAGTNVTFDWRTINGTASSPGDYTAVSWTPVTITAGQTSASLVVNLTNDISVESTETFTVEIANLVGATTNNAQTTVTITDNDSTPWLEGYQYRRRITLNNRGQNETFSNFQTAVHVPSGFDFSKTLESGNDIRFTSSDGTTPLNFEIDEWNDSGSSGSPSYLWVKVPTITASSGSDFVYMYYGNNAALSGQNAAQTWSNGYSRVHHMNVYNTSSGITSARAIISAANTTVFRIVINGQNFGFTSDSSATNAEVQAGLVSAINAAPPAGVSAAATPGTTNSVTITAASPITLDAFVQNPVATGTFARSSRLYFYVDGWAGVPQNGLKLFVDSVANNTTYSVMINSDTISYISDASATRTEIINGLVNAFNTSGLTGFSATRSSNTQARVRIDTVANSTLYSVVLAGTPCNFNSDGTATRDEIRDGLISAINSCGVSGYSASIDGDRVLVTTNTPQLVDTGSNLSLDTMAIHVLSPAAPYNVLLSSRLSGSLNTGIVTSDSVSAKGLAGNFSAFTNMNGLESGMSPLGRGIRIEGMTTMYDLLETTLPTLATIEFWYMPKSQSSFHRAVWTEEFAVGVSSGDSLMYLLGSGPLITDTRSSQQMDDGSLETACAACTRGPPQHLTFTHDLSDITATGVSLRMYLNGLNVMDSQWVSPTPFLQTTDTLLFANRPDGLNRQMRGTIDEFRISNVRRSNDWIRAQYASMVNAEQRIQISTVSNNSLYQITIGSTTFGFTSDGTATNIEIRDGLIAAINADSSAPVVASPNGSDRIYLNPKTTTFASEFTISTNSHLSLRQNFALQTQTLVTIPSAQNSTAYTLAINGQNLTYTSDADATLSEIQSGLLAAIASSTELIQATAVGGDQLRLTSDLTNARVSISTSGNMTSTGTSVGFQTNPAVTLASITNNTVYSVTVNSTVISFTSDSSATDHEISDGLVKDLGAKTRLTQVRARIAALNQIVLYPDPEFVISHNGNLLVQSISTPFALWGNEESAPAP